MVKNYQNIHLITLITNMSDNGSKEIKNIALLGGTFDPIHHGHTESAKHVASWLAIDKVLLMPSHIPPHKNNTSATAEQRTAMVKLVCQNETVFSCDERELKRHNKSYTVDTLKEIKQESPNSTLFFIIGMDSLLNFTTWHHWREILSLCHIVVNARPDYSLNKLTAETEQLLAQYKVNNLAQIKDKTFGHILFSPPISCDVSSTQIRARIQKQLDCQQLVSNQVLNYINQHQLYC